MKDEAPELAGRVPGAPDDVRRRWFMDHARGAAGEIRSFLADAGLTLDGRRVLDLGCGDGMITLGLALGSSAQHVVGSDIVPTDVADLGALCERNLGRPLPPQLSFEVCTETTLPFETASFDVITSWSLFEHVSRPVEVLTEMRRVLRPGGSMFLQIWPLYHSEHGSHLWYWYPEGFAHLLRPGDDLRAEVKRSDIQAPDVIDAVLVDFDTLNRITMDELHRALRASGFHVARVELMTGTTIVPEELADQPLVDLLVAGVKLIALPVE